MPFCPKCGKEIGEGMSFCPSCGASIARTEKKGETKKGNLDVRTYLLISCASIGALSLVALIMKDVLGFVLGCCACAAMYFWGIKKLDEKDINTAQLTALIVGIVVAAVGLVAILSGSFVGILDVAAAIPAFLAWNMLRK